jgi:O-methyltransferase
MHSELSPASTTSDLYLDLLKKTLTRAICPDLYAEVPKNTSTALKSLRYHAYAAVLKVLKPMNLSIVHTVRPTGETMIGMELMDHLHECLETVIRERVPGDVIETGVWRGGATIFMRAVLQVHGDPRNVWVADSFEGLPKPNAGKYPQDRGDALWSQSYLAVSLDEVKANFRKYNLLDSQVKFLKGFFSETLPSAPIGSLALMRLDGDMYESTIVALRSLYPKLSRGGFVIVDDFGMIPACDEAVHDFRKEAGVTETLRTIAYIRGNPLGACWQKQG